MEAAVRGEVMSRKIIHLNQEEFACRELPSRDRPVSETYAEVVQLAKYQFVKRILGNLDNPDVSNSFDLELPLEHDDVLYSCDSEIDG